jgi:hypothetical protein
VRDRPALLGRTSCGWGPEQCTFSAHGSRRAPEAVRSDRDERRGQGRFSRPAHRPPEGPGTGKGRGFKSRHPDQHEGRSYGAGLRRVRGPTGASPCPGTRHASPIGTPASVQRLPRADDLSPVDGSTKTPGTRRRTALARPRTCLRNRAKLACTGRSRATRRGGGSTPAAGRATSTTYPADTSTACTSRSSLNLGSFFGGMSGSAVSVPMFGSGRGVSRD